MTSANNGVRSFAKTTGVLTQVSQRMKRYSTILDKLKREPGELGRMQDIAGCRAVVEIIEELEILCQHIAKRSNVVKVADYVNKPRESGYRAVHIIMKYQGFLVEVQLRTKWMHEWAEAVEKTSGELGINYKHDGNHPYQLFFKAIANLMAFNQQPTHLEKSLDGLNDPTKLREFRDRKARLLKELENARDSVREWLKERERNASPTFHFGD